MKVRRVLVVLPNWFGETLFATPFIHALRQGLPEADLMTLGLPQCRSMLLHNPDVHEILDYNERAGPAGWMEVWKTARRLKRFRFDAAVILRKSFSRTLALAIAGIPRRIGFDHPKTRWLLTDRVPGPQAAVHKAATYLALLSPFDFTAELSPYIYVVSDEERLKIRRWLVQEGLRLESPLVILHPGANWEHKRWRPERFAMLGDHLAETYGAQIGITGSLEDRELVLSVAQNMRTAARVWAGAMTLRQLGACLEQARLFVSNDTGVLHLAAAVGCRTVGVYGPTSPALTGPLGSEDRVSVVHGKKSCPKIPCYAPKWPPHPGMDAVDVEVVAKAISELFAKGR